MSDYSIVRGTIAALILQLVFCIVSYAGPYRFERIVIDDNYNNGARPGWSRLGDVNQDGYVDVVAGGGNYIAAYENPAWRGSPEWGERIIGAAGSNGGLLYDIDRDGDLDVITSVKNEGFRLFWFENPVRRHPASENMEHWTRRIVDTGGNLTFMHDLEIGDIDMDGVPDDFVALYDDYRRGVATVKWYRLPDHPEYQSWSQTVIAEQTAGGVGLAVGDINGDGRNDVVRSGLWYQAPADPQSQNWIEHRITDLHLTNVRVRDLDRDGDLDIAAADGWSDEGAVIWLENLGEGRSFRVHRIATLYHPENMVVLDLDNDGDDEIITGEMRGESESNFLVFENPDPRIDRDWVKHTVSGSNGICARMNADDVDADGDLDIVCDGNAQSLITLWINQSERRRDPAPSFRFFNLDDQYAPGWIRAADMDNDGDLDIIAGGGKKLYIYENDGSARGWKRHGSLEASARIGCNAAELYDVDRDGDLDVLASMKYTELGWWANPGPPLSSKPWEYSPYFPSEKFYLHDMIRADVDGDGLAEEFVTNTNSGYWQSMVKLFWFRVPDMPGRLWSGNVIEPGRRESFHGHAGLDMGDINGDGIPDLAYANGWYQGPAGAGGEWIWNPVTEIYGVSNTLIRDLDLDRQMDLVVSAGHHGRGVYWLRRRGDGWQQMTIDAHVHNPEGLGAADMDNDGDLDLVAAELFFGERPGEPDWEDDVHNCYLYLNTGGLPPVFEKVNIAPRVRPCHSLQLIDINEDGLMDIIAESSGAAGVLYLENAGL